MSIPINDLIFEGIKIFYWPHHSVSIDFNLRKKSCVIAKKKVLIFKISIFELWPEASYRLPYLYPR